MPKTERAVKIENGTKYFVPESDHGGNMDNYELSELFSNMWRKSRSDAGFSQEQVARKLGVSKTTVQNWENGVSSPNWQTGFRWFEALGLQPFPYCLQVVNEKFRSVSPESDDGEITAALLAAVAMLPMRQKRELLFWLYGEHGSSPTAILEAVTAHLHLPLDKRIMVGSEIVSAYEVSERMGEIQQNEHVKPEIEFIKTAIDKALDSTESNVCSYTLM